MAVLTKAATVWFQVEISTSHKEDHDQVDAFRTRPLDAEYPYLMLDATFDKVRENGDDGPAQGADTLGRERSGAALEPHAAAGR